MKDFIKKVVWVEPLIRPFGSSTLENNINGIEKKHKLNTETNTVSANTESTPSIPSTPNTNNPYINPVDNMPKKFSLQTSRDEEFYRDPIKPSSSKAYYIDDTPKIETMEDLAAFIDGDKYIKELPPSPVKPSYLTDASHNRIISVQASIDLIKEGVAPMEAIVTGAYTTAGHPGRFADRYNAVTKHVPPCKGKHNFVPNLSEEVVNNSAPKDLEQLSNMSLKEPTRFAEYVALAKVNTGLWAKLTYAKGENPAPHSLSGYYNKTPNTKPDYVCYLPQPINDVTAMGVDFKYTEGWHTNQDVLLGCSTNIERHMVISHNMIYKHIQQRIADNTISGKDKEVAEQLMDKLTQNLALYKENRDLNAAISSYNGLRNDHLPFLVENKVGMTLLAPIDRSDFVIKQETKKAYLERFMAYYTNSDSSLQAMLNRQAEANFGKIPDENHFLTALAKWNFPEK